MTTILTAVAASVAPVRLPENITPEHIRFMHETAALQVFAAVMLSVAMIMAFLATAAFAFRFQKTGFVCMLLFGTAVYTVPSGYAMIYGVLIVFMALVGLLMQLFTNPKRHLPAEAASRRA